MKNKICLLGLLLALLVFGTPRAQAAEYFHPMLKSGKKPLHKVLVLPPKAQFVKSGIKGGEPMFKEAERVEAVVLWMVSRALRENGFETIENVLTAQALQEDSDLKSALAGVQSKYDTLAPKLHKNSKDIKKGRFSLGDSVANFTPAASADALVFIRSQGMALTSGKKTFGILVGGPKRSRIDLFITLVDARTGEVLFLTKFFGLGDFVDNPDEVLGKKVDKSIKKLREGKR